MDKGLHESSVEKLDEGFQFITHAKTSFLLEVILSTENFLEVLQGKQSKIIGNDSESCSTA